MDVQADPFNFAENKYDCWLKFEHSTFDITVIFSFKFTQAKGVFALGSPSIEKRGNDKFLSLELLAALGEVVSKHETTIIPLLNTYFKWKPKKEAPKETI